MKRRAYIIPKAMAIGMVPLAFLNDSPYKQSTDAADAQEAADGVELGSNKVNLWDEEETTRP